VRWTLVASTLVGQGYFLEFLGTELFSTSCRYVAWVLLTRISHLYSYNYSNRDLTRRDTRICIVTLAQNVRVFIRRNILLWTSPCHKTPDERVAEEKTTETQEVYVRGRYISQEKSRAAKETKAEGRTRWIDEITNHPRNLGEQPKRSTARWNPRKHHDNSDSRSKPKKIILEAENKGKNKKTKNRCPK